MIVIGVVFNAVLFAGIYYLLYRYTGMGKWWDNLDDTKYGWSAAVVVIYIHFCFLPFWKVPGLITVCEFNLDEAGIAIAKSDLLMCVEYIVKNLIARAVMLVFLSPGWIVLCIFCVQWPAHFIPNVGPIGVLYYFTGFPIMAALGLGIICLPFKMG